jgi:outer membrane autotransporter protein
VTFFDNGTAIGSQALSSTGSASMTISSLTQGTHVFTARYNGDGTFSAATSDPLLQTVSASLDSANLRSVQAGASNAAALVSGDAIAGAIVAATSESALMNPVTIGPTGVRFSFAAEPAPATSAFARLGTAGGRAAAPPQREWVGWGDIRGTNWRGGDMSGNQLNVLGGITRLLSPDLLLGGAVGYENFRYRVDPVAGSLDGRGATLAGYGKWRAADRVWLDGAIAYSHINYQAAAGAAAGSFSGNRWLVSLGLSGLYSLASVTFEPSARVFAVWERQGGYTDSLGTAQDARNFSTGRASVGGKFSRAYAVTGDGTLTPNFGLYADYAFSRDTTIPGLGFVPTSKRLSARLAPGVSWTIPGRATIALDGSIAGLGADYKILSLMMRGQIPF